MVKGRTFMNVKLTDYARVNAFVEHLLFKILLILRMSLLKIK